jgi:hypothetical protein
MGQIKKSKLKVTKPTNNTFFVKADFIIYACVQALVGTLPVYFLGALLGAFLEARCRSQIHELAILRYAPFAR